MTAHQVRVKKACSRTPHRAWRVLDDYLRRAATGTAPDRQALLLDHPELADSLRACLASLEWGDAGRETDDSTQSYHGRSPPEHVDPPDDAALAPPKLTIVGLSTESPREYCRCVARLMVVTWRPLAATDASLFGT